MLYVVYKYNQLYLNVYLHNHIQSISVRKRLIALKFVSPEAVL